MAVACVALGGTGYAAIKLPRASVGTRELKPNAVTGGKVRDGSHTSSDFAGLASTRGPRGLQGPQGAQGPKGDPGESGTGGSRAGFTARESGGALLTLTPVNTMVDVLDIAVPAGSSGYVASSGNIVVTAPSRLVAVANVTVHSTTDVSSLFCRLLLNGTTQVGATSNTALGTNSHVALPVTGGVDVDPGSHNLRVQCSVSTPGFTFARGSLTAVATPR